MKEPSPDLAPGLVSASRTDEERMKYVYISRQGTLQ